MYKVVTKTASKYALVEKGSTITDEQNTNNVNHNNPQTGDSSNTILWFMLALASAGMLTVLTFWGKRKISKSIIFFM